MAKFPTKLIFTHNGQVISRAEAIKIANEKVNGKKQESNQVKNSSTGK